MNPGNSQQALAQLQGIQKTAKDPNTILSQQKQQLGVNAAQDTALGLRGAIDNTTKLLKQVAPSVMGRTGNSLVTSAQANRIIQNEQAPISQNLTEQGTKYNQAQEDLSTLQQRAQEAASGIYQGQQDKLSYLQNLYNTLYQREADAKAARQAELDRQEKIREFNASLAESRRAASAGSFGLGGLGGTSTPAKSGVSGLKNNYAFNKKAGTFAFTNKYGNPISAASYAAEKGIPFRDLLGIMARAGDQGAKKALGFVGNDYGYDPGKIGNNTGLYNALVWGTGKQYNASKAKSSSNRASVPVRRTYSSGLGLGGR